MAAVLPVSKQAITAQILYATNTGKVDVVDNSAGTKAVRVDSLNLVSDDSANKDIQFSLLSGATSYVVGTVAVLAGAGNSSGVARTRVLDLVSVQDSDGIPCIWVGAGIKLQANATAQLTSGKTIHITGAYRKFE